MVSSPPVIWWAAPGTSESAGTWPAGTTAPLEIRTTSMCMPWTRFAKATPHRMEGSQALIVCTQSQRSRQVWQLTLGRHSMAHTRTMRHSRMMNRTM